MRLEWIQGLIEADEIARDQLGPLVDELVERMLAVGPGLSPDDRPGLVVHRHALQIDMFAVALHVELLQVGGQTPKVVIIGQDRYSLGIEEVVVPDADQSQEHGQVALERSSAEMLVHRVEAGEHFAKPVGADSDHEG